MTAPTPYPLTSNDWDRYFELAIQYYLATRAAVIQGMAPVAGNLAHHAVEMLLKSALSSRYSPAQLKARFSHNLAKMWSEFKSLLGDQSLSRLDNAVNHISKWEDIRYPGFPRGKSVTMDVGITKTGMRSPANRTTSDSYSLSLEELDDVMHGLITRLGINPPYMRLVIKRYDKLSLYARDNQHLIP